MCSEDSPPCQLEFVSYDGEYYDCDKRTPYIIEKFPRGTPFTFYNLTLMGDTIYANIKYIFNDGIEDNCIGILHKKE